MRFILFLSTILIISFSSCGDTATSTASSEPAKGSATSQPARGSATSQPSAKAVYPAELVKVFDAHGGLDKWKSMNSMSYEIVKEEGNEKQTIDLKDRREVVKGSNFTCGYDGQDYWVEADTSYKGNPKFYTNLMFYFYAMPFVLADNGISYSDTEPLEYEGKSYPGVRITYGDGVGISPKDEYFMYYDADTHQMAWLGYTVTFFSKEKGKKKSYIRYNDWKKFTGLYLPNSLTWFKAKDGRLIEPRNTRKFTKVVVAERPMDDATFTKPAGAKVVE